ncbi:MAG TPA: hypothetical protein VLG12_00720 [Candidatus Saccharimonadales bacterium]|nr:hypothetical protein [Candidatus Saccharimonadales bacterium]
MLFYTKKISLVTTIGKIDKMPLVVIIILAILFSYSMLFNGYYPDGIHLMLANYSDAPLHLSFINELQVHFPPQNPGFAGTQLHDYHFFSDYVLAKIIQLFHIDKIFAYFQLFPILISLLWGTGTYLFIKRWIDNRAAALWAVILTQFGGSFVFLTYLFGYSGLNLNSGFGMLQPGSSVLNPPYATSIVLVIFGLFSLLRYLQTNKKGWIFPIILFFGLAAEFKVYAGIILFGGFVLLMILKAMKQQFHFLWIFLGMIIIFALTYLRVIGKGGFLIFFPYWAPISVARANLRFLSYDNQMATYEGFHMWHRIIWLQLKIFIIFLFGNIGSRIIGIILLYFYPLKKKFFFSEFTITVLCMLGISFFLPLFFIQSIKPFEITQMFNYFLFFVSLFAAIGLGAFFTRPFSLFIKIAVSLFVILLVLPTNYDVYYNYLPTSYPSISTKAYKAMKYLEQQESYSSTVLVMPEQQIFPPNYAWIHSTNLFVPAFANKRAYLNDQNLTFPDDVKKRGVFVESLATIEEPSKSTKVTKKDITENLHKNHIRFIYSPYKFPVVGDIGIKSIYISNEAYIYKVL